MDPPKNVMLTLICSSGVSPRLVEIATRMPARACFVLCASSPGEQRARFHDSALTRLHRTYSVADVVSLIRVAQTIVSIV